MKQLLGLACVLCIITGCSDKTPSTTVCKGAINETTIEDTLSAEGDKIVKDTVVSSVDFNGAPGDLIMTDEEILEYVSGLEEFKAIEKFNEVDGVKAKLEVKDGFVMRTIEIDYNVVKLESLEKVGLIESSEGADYVSLEKTVEYMEKNINAACKTEKDK